MVPMRNALTTRLLGFLGANTISNPMEDGSSLGHEERATDSARQTVRGTLAELNLEMLGTNKNCCCIPGLGPLNLRSGLNLI